MSREDADQDRENRIELAKAGKAADAARRVKSRDFDQLAEARETPKAILSRIACHLYRR